MAQGEMERVEFLLHEEELDELDKLWQESNEFDDRAGAIRYSIREFIDRRKARRNEYEDRRRQTQRGSEE